MGLAELYGAVFEFVPSIKYPNTKYWYTNVDQREAGQGHIYKIDSAIWYLSRHAGWSDRDLYNARTHATETTRPSNHER